MIMIWTSATFGYYLIGFQMKYFKGNFFINNITSSVTEIFAYVISCFIFKLCGINLTCVVSYMVAIAGMLCLVLIDTKNQFLLSLFILGSKYGVCQLFNIAFIGNTHLFPISMVATSFTVCNLIARSTAISAPYVAELKPECISEWTFITLMVVSLFVS